MGLDSMGPLRFFFSINTVPYIHVFSLMTLVHSFSLAYFSVRIQYKICITYKVCVNQLFMLSVRFPVNKRPWAVKFWRSQKLYEFLITQASLPQPYVVQWSTVYP